jgi:hypothetical protein
VHRGFQPLRQVLARVFEVVLRVWRWVARVLVRVLFLRVLPGWGWVVPGWVVRPLVVRAKGRRVLQQPGPWGEAHQSCCSHSKKDQLYFRFIFYIVGFENTSAGI